MQIYPLHSKFKLLLYIEVVLFFHLHARLCCAFTSVLVDLTSREAITKRTVLGSSPSLSDDFLDTPFLLQSLNGGPKITGTERDIATHVELVDKSLRDLTGIGVSERMGLDLESPELYESICTNTRYVLITHGTEADPIYNFGNNAALAAFFRSWESLVAMPSAQSVVLRSIDEEMRIILMKKVTDDGFVEGASGIRVRDDGAYIKLVDAIVWNCHDKSGAKIGQAAFFDRKKCPIIDTLDQA